jgi:hypothetical protein
VLDVDWDNDSDVVMLYISEEGDYEHISIIGLDQSSEDCTVLFDKPLIVPIRQATGERFEVRICRIEAIELTGDNQPELHIWLQLRGSAVRRDEYHAILTRTDGRWHHALGTNGLARIPPDTFFEFRDAPSGKTQDIHLESANRLTGKTTHTILRWNGSEFAPLKR